MVLILLLIASVSCFPENFRVIVKVDQKPVNEDLVLDLEKNSFLVNVGDVTNLGTEWSSSINLHDFNVQKLAFKYVDTGICYVTDMTEDLADISARLHNMTSQIFATNLTQHFYRLTKTSMTNENLIAYAGSKIASFCRGYRTIYAHRLENDELHRRSVPHISFKRSCCGCSSHAFMETEARYKPLQADTFEGLQAARYEP